MRKTVLNGDRSKLSWLTKSQEAERVNTSSIKVVNKALKLKPLAEGEILKTPSKILSFNYWLFPIFILLLCLPIAGLGDAGRALFRYEVIALETGQIWRWVTGHMAHLGWSHYVLNGCGLLAVWALYGGQFTARAWAVIFLLCSAGISLGFYVFNPEMFYYVGLSGVLHGALAAALARSILGGAFEKPPRIALEDIVIAAGLLSKIYYEQFIGAVPLTESLSGDTVIVNSHFYGLIIGTVAGLFSFLAKREEDVRF